jgi:WhiB family redox-sensing transcriptional regulator
MSDLLRLSQYAPTTHGPLEWQEEVACRDVDPEIFFPEKDGSYADARRVCSQCPVLDECRRWNDRIEGNRWVRGCFGMYAGETPGERIARRKRSAA